jgi:hypothetical protein
MAALFELWGLVAKTQQPSRLSSNEGDDVTMKLVE